MSAATRVVLAAVLAAICVVADAGAQIAPPSCTPVGQNLFVRDVLTDLYLWYRELPELDPAAFESPEAYLDAVRYRPLDSSFSHITSRQASDAFFSDSQFIGFGLSFTVSGSAMRVTQVFPESPALEAGLARGHRLIEIGGRSVADLIASDALDGAFGPSEIGVKVDVVFEDRAGRRTRATMVKRLVTIPTVSLTRVYDVGGKRVGYIFFRNFVEPSIAALDAAFDELREAGVTELVLDVRYNGGGLVNVAQHLGALVGGVVTNGQIFARYWHNDKNAFRDRTLRFGSSPKALTLSRLVVVATRASASASELIINALRPFMPVLVVGDRTFGKPVGQYSIPFCDKVVAPVAFTLRNSRGEGDFFDGFAPDCTAADDIDRELGDPAEASLAEGLHVASTGACSPRASVLAGRLAPERSAAGRAGGWRTIVGAY